MTDATAPRAAPPTAVPVAVAVAVAVRDPAAGGADRLEDVAAERGMRSRDCRDCRHLEPGGDGLAYGWCGAHLQFVKLYHPPGAFWSQCQFKALTRVPRGGAATADRS